MDLRSDFFKLNFFFHFILCLVISSCGGSAGSSNQPLLDISAGAVMKPLFNSNPIIIDDAASYYSHACNNPTFQFLIPLNINDDEHIDFISHFWCDSLTPGEYDQTPVPDALVANLNDGYGNYSISNLSVFGEIYPKLGGASRKYAIGDINNDGKQDVAFAMNWEDGRASYDYDSMISNYSGRFFAQSIKSWVLISWTFQTLGILVGSIWAYYELGWGGFWFWDPVENASLLPWFAMTALLHSLLVLEKRNTLYFWTIILCLMTFTLSVTGTFLVRSGILNSVHTFANDPSRGIYILIFLSLMIFASIYFLFSKYKPTNDLINSNSKETFVLINNWFMMFYLVTVLLTK